MSDGERLAGGAIGAAPVGDDDRMRLFVEHAPAALAMFDRGMRYLAFSRKWVADYALGDRPLLGRSHYEVFPEIPERWKEVHRRCLAGAVERADLDPFERADGRVQWLRWEVRPWHDAAGAVGGVLMFTEDLTDRKRIEESLLESEARTRVALEAGGLGTWRFDFAGRRIHVDDTVRRLHGFGHTAVAAREWLARVHPEDVARVRREMGLEEDDPAARDRFQCEYRVALEDGGERWVAVLARVHRDGAGAPRYVVGTLQETTERRRLEEQLLAARQLEAIGRLAGGVAHDFNNLLTVIAGNAELLDLSLADGTAERRQLAEIREASERAAGLVRQLLAFSRAQVLSPRVIDLNEVVQRIAPILRPLLGERIALAWDLAPAPLRVRIDPLQLEQVLFDLAANASEAMPRGGRLTLATGVGELEAERRRRRPAAPAGPWARLTVRDTGVGMPDEVQARIFEPFFTTKEFGRGAGLGLATAFGIVEQSGGLLEVESAVGRGTTFTILLPCAPGPSEPAGAAQ
jgi:PAS domain S-box-containing protein